jgi:hypothetical protein
MYISSPSSKNDKNGPVQFSPYQQLGPDTQGMRYYQSTQRRITTLACYLRNKHALNCLGSTRNNYSQTASSSVLCRPCSWLLSLPPSKVSVSNQGNCVRTSQFLILDSKPSRKFSDIFSWYFPAPWSKGRRPSMKRFAADVRCTSELLSDSPSPIQRGSWSGIAKEESEMLIKLMLQATSKKS